MTNYDWLVKNKQLNTFIWDINNFTKEQLKGKYGIIVDWGDVASEKIADWLQAEYQGHQETNVRKVDCFITEDEYNEGLNDLREGARKVVKQLSKDDFIKNNCYNCGTQRCGGPDTEWFEGCSLKDELKKEE